MIKCTEEEIREFEDNSMFFIEQAIINGASDNNIKIKNKAKAATIPLAIDNKLHTVLFSEDSGMWELKKDKIVSLKDGRSIDISKYLEIAYKKHNYCRELSMSKLAK